MWQFTIIDYTQNPTNPQSTILQEPVGWDAVNLHLKRDETGHGFFGFEDDTFSSLQYDGNGAGILRAAYYGYGIQAKVQLAVTYACDDEDPADNLYLGTFDFTTFKDYTADRCYVECATLVSEAYYLFKNRKDQQVDLDSLASFDQLPVQQSVTCNAAFEGGTNQIRVSQLLNGLMAGSQIVILGSSQPQPVFTVASAKPDYSNVNPDLAGANTSGTLVASVTFDAANNRLDIGQLVNINPGTVLTLNTATWPSGNNNYPLFDNSGTYNVLAVQQFFSYTRLTVRLQGINATDAPHTLNAQGTPYYVSTTQDSVIITGTITYTAQPTATIITVAENVSDEMAGAVFTGSITGTTLTVTAIGADAGALAVGQSLTGGQGVPYGASIMAQTSGTTGGVGTYTISVAPATPVTNQTISTGITLNGQWLQNNMQAYSALSKIITVPAKVIEATSIWKAVTDTEYQLNNRLSPTYSNSSGGLILVPDWVNIQSDIDETHVGDGISNYIGDDGNPVEYLLFFRQSSLPCSGAGSFEMQMSGQFAANGSYNYDTSLTSNSFTISDNFSPQTPGSFRVTVAIAQQYDASLIEGSGPNIAYSALWPITKSGNVGNFNVQFSVPNVNIPPGNYVWVFFQMAAFSNVSRNDIFPTMLTAANSYFKFTINSQCEDTPCSVYLVNEALSRCAESYTNGEIQVYSDYFGRSNAQPVASPANGCGALAAITSGLRIRGCVMPDGSAIPKFCTSLNDMFTALDAIHNIGMGMEADPHRPGMLRLRIEPFEYWFPATIIPLPGMPDPAHIVLEGVMNYTREVQTSLLCSSFKCGYQQFETWNNNGLYDIFGDRKYRTPLNHLENEIDKTCKWMASDYAIEFTRRQFGVTTSDSRYDDATFILCLTQGNTQPVTFWAASGMILGVNAELGVIAGGNTYTVTISGSQHNDGSYNIFWCDTSAGADYAYFILSGGTTVAESALNISIDFYLAGNSHAVVSFQNAFAVFIDATHGAIQFKPPGSATELESISVGDTLQLSGSAFPWMNTQLVVGQLFYPSAAYGDVLPTPAPVNTDFPMIIIPRDATLFAQLAPTYYPVSFQDSTSTLYLVEQGMQNGTNVLSPDTVMNYRISPAHAALRHYRNIITDRQYASQHLIFTGGTGNFYALGTLTGSCAPEDAQLNLSEGSYLSLTNFAVPDDGKPLFYAEIVKFDYPLTWAQFLAIQANPYGLIQYQHANDSVQQGWITDLQYHPYTGLAEFTLYPKI